MTSTMSSRERMMAAMTLNGPDHVPFSPYIGQGPWYEKPLFWHDQFQRTEVMLELGLDPTIDIWLPWPHPAPEVKIKTWRATGGSEPLLTKEYHTPAGILRQTVRETEDWCDARHTRWIPTTMGTEQREQFNMDILDDWNISRRSEPWVKGRDDLEALRYLMRVPEGHVLEEWKMDTARALEFARKHDLVSVARRTIVGDAFQWFCDIEQFMIWMIEDTGFVKEFLGIWQEWSLAMTKLALEAGVDVVQRRGWYEIPTFWGLKYFKEYLVPLIEEETKMVHAAGKLHVYLLPEGQGAYTPLLKEMSADVMMGVDPRMLHGGDLKSLFQAMGNNKAFWGGVNAEVTLESGKPEIIDEAVKTAIEELGGNGGLILGGFIFQQITAEMITMMIASWKKYREMHAVRRG